MILEMSSLRHNIACASKTQQILSLVLFQQSLYFLLVIHGIYYLLVIIASLQCVELAKMLTLILLFLPGINNYCFNFCYANSILQYFQQIFTNACASIQCNCNTRGKQRYYAMNIIMNMITFRRCTVCLYYQCVTTNNGQAYKYTTRLDVLRPDDSFFEQ